MPGTNDRLINYAQGEDIIAALETIAAKSLHPYDDDNKLDADYVGPMTSYEKASTVSAISTTDTLNQAIGKLEKKADTISDFITTNPHLYVDNDGDIAIDYGS